MNEYNKSQLENIKKEAREFKRSLSHVIVVSFILFVAGITIWQMWGLFKIFFIENIGETLQSILGLIFWGVVAIIVIFIKGWWDERQNKKTMDEIRRDLHKERQADQSKEETQVIFFNKNPKKPNDNE